MRKLLIILLLSGLAACRQEPPAADRPQWISPAAMIEKAIATTIATGQPVRKTFTLNGRSESRLYPRPDSSFWHNELNRLLALDLNAPAYLDAVVPDTGRPDTASNLLTDTYRIRPEARLPLQYLRIYYLDNPQAPRRFEFRWEQQSLLGGSLLHVNLWLGQLRGQAVIDSLTIEGLDRTRWQGPRQYRLKVERLPG